MDPEQGNHHAGTVIPMFLAGAMLIAIGFLIKSGAFFPADTILTVLGWLTVGLGALLIFGAPILGAERASSTSDGEADSQARQERKS